MLKNINVYRRFFSIGIYQQKLMSTPRITLKQYITSYNYKKQLESHSRSKQKNAPPRKTYLQVEGGPRVKNQPLIQKQVEKIKLYSRSIIHDDYQFAQLEKLVSELLRIFIRQIQNQRNSHTVLNSMIKMSTTRMSPKHQKEKVIKMEFDENGNLCPIQLNRENRFSSLPKSSVMRRQYNLGASHININSNVKILKPVTDEPFNELPKTVLNNHNNYLNVTDNKLGRTSKQDMNALEIDLFKMKMSACKKDDDYDLFASDIRDSCVNVDIGDTNMGETDFDIFDTNNGKKNTLMEFDNQNEYQYETTFEKSKIQYPNERGIAQGRRLYETKNKNSPLLHKFQIKLEMCE